MQQFALLQTGRALSMVYTSANTPQSPHETTLNSPELYLDMHQVQHTHRYWSF